MHTARSENFSMSQSVIDIGRAGIFRLLFLFFIYCFCCFPHTISIIREFNISNGSRWMKFHRESEIHFSIESCCTFSKAIICNESCACEESISRIVVWQSAVKTVDDARERSEFIDTGALHGKFFCYYFPDCALRLQSLLLWAIITVRSTKSFFVWATINERASCDYINRETRTLYITSSLRIFSLS